MGQESETGVDGRAWGDGAEADAPALEPEIRAPSGDERGPEGRPDRAQDVESLIEAALLTSGRPMGEDELAGLFAPQASGGEIAAAIGRLKGRWAGRALTLRLEPLGWAFGVELDAARRLPDLYEERTPKYSSAVLETLTIIAYRQPVTRIEIEQIRGVRVSSSILQTLVDRGWVEAVGRKEALGRPMLYATTDGFLRDLGLRSLSDLPQIATVAELFAQDREQSDAFAAFSAAGPSGAVEPPGRGDEGGDGGGETKIAQGDKPDGEEESEGKCRPPLKDAQGSPLGADAGKERAGLSAEIPGAPEWGPPDGEAAGPVAGGLGALDGAAQAEDAPSPEEPGFSPPRSAPAANGRPVEDGRDSPETGG